MMPTQQDDAVGTANVAKAALRLLAEHRLLPTPENYEQAWRRVTRSMKADGAGERASREPSPATLAPEPADASGAGRKGASGAPAWVLEGLVRQLREQQVLTPEHAARVRESIESHEWPAVAYRLDAALRERPQARAWGPLVEQLFKEFEVTHRGWTTARKREALFRVLRHLGRRDEQLHERLRALIDSWQAESRQAPIDVHLPDGAHDEGDVMPTASAAGQPEVSGSATDEPSLTGDRPGPTAPWAAERDKRLMLEMTALLSTLCDNLADMTDQTSWIQGQIDLIRQSLRNPDDRRRLSEARRMIAEHADTQRQIQADRRRSIDEVRRMISTWIESVGDLSRSAGEFGDRIGTYAASINRVESIEELGETMHDMLADTQAMSREILSSQTEMEAMRARAIALENEVSRLESELAAASTQIIVDHLTQTMNRRGLEEAFLGAQARAAQYGESLTLAVLDVDDFKRLNDTLGHKGGDLALQQLARLFKDKLRATDAIARFGGEEFVLLLPGLTAEQAVAHVVRLQREVTSHVFMSDEKRMFITFSAGVTTVRAEDSLTDAVERADQAMYAAKLAGKNCVRAV